MEELTPIRQIKVNFGNPLILFSPSHDALVERVTREVEEVDDNPLDALEADFSVWEASISPEERKTFEDLTARLDSAGKAFSPGKDNDNTPAAEECYKAVDEREKFIVSTGKHLCFRCSYYIVVKGDGETYSAHCERMNGVCGVRPYCISCPHFTTDDTPIILKARKEYEEACRKDPGFARFAINEHRKDIARLFVKNTNTSPSTTFFIFQNNPAYYERLYRDFPLIMSESKYPTFQLFQEAFKRWEKDVIIKRERGENGEEGVTLSMSQKEFLPTVTHIPPDRGCN